MTSTVRPWKCGPAAIRTRVVLIRPLQTRNRFGEYGPVSGIANGEKQRGFQGTSLEQAFANPSKWNGGIWGTAIGSGLKGSSNEANRPQGRTWLGSRYGSLSANMLLGDIDTGLPDHSEAITGSGSLLSSSESDTWSRHQNSQWPSVNNISPGQASVRSHHENTSPKRHRTSNAQQSRSDSPYFSTNQPSAIGQIVPHKALNQSYLEPTPGSFKNSGAFDPYQPTKVGRQSSDSSDRRPLESIVFGNNDMAYNANHSLSNASATYSGYNSSAASRSGSLPPSRHSIDPPSQYGLEPSTNSQQVPYASSGPYLHRPNQSSRTSTYSTNGNSRYTDQAHTTQYNDLSTAMNKLDLGKENQESAYNSLYDYSQSALPSNVGTGYGMSNTGYRSNSISADLDHRQASTAVPSYNQNRVLLGDHNSHSPPSNDYHRRSHDSPIYPQNSNPHLIDHQRAGSMASVRSNVGTGQAALLERRLRGLQQEQQNYSMAPPNPLQYRAPFAPPYDYSPPNMLRMNPFAQYYPMQVVNGYQGSRAIPRMPAIENNAGESLRSSLLEEFRTHSKGTKRYELKVSVIRSMTSQTLLMTCRIFIIMWSNSVEISTAHASSNKSSRVPTVMRRSRSFARSYRIRYN